MFPDLTPSSSIDTLTYSDHSLFAATSAEVVEYTQPADYYTCHIPVLSHRSDPSIHRPRATVTAQTSVPKGHDPSFFVREEVISWASYHNFSEQMTGYPQPPPSFEQEIPQCTLHGPHVVFNEAIMEPYRIENLAVDVHTPFVLPIPMSKNKLMARIAEIDDLRAMMNGHYTIKQDLVDQDADSDLGMKIWVEEHPFARQLPNSGIRFKPVQQVEEEREHRAQANLKKLFETAELGEEFDKVRRQSGWYYPNWASEASRGLDEFLKHLQMQLENLLPFEKEVEDRKKNKIPKGPRLNEPWQTSWTGGASRTGFRRYPNRHTLGGHNRRMPTSGTVTSFIQEVTYCTYPAP